jgi:hypothetical protein
VSERWKYKTAKVTIDDNSQTVRMLTAGERRAFGAASAKKRAGELEGADLADMVLQFGTVDPNLSAEDIAAMPVELYAACTTKILELTGLKSDPDTVEEVGVEKKETAPEMPLNS